MIYCLPSITNCQAANELLTKIETERDESVDNLSIQTGWIFYNEHKIIAFLSILPYIETSGSIYFTSHSQTCHVSRIVLIKPFPLSVILRTFYAASKCKYFDFPLKLTSNPMESAKRFNERLGFSLDYNGFYHKSIQTPFNLPFITQEQVTAYF